MIFYEVPHFYASHHLFPFSQILRVSSGVDVALVAAPARRANHIISALHMRRFPKRLGYGPGAHLTQRLQVAYENTTLAARCPLAPHWSSRHGLLAGRRRS